MKPAQKQIALDIINKLADRKLSHRSRLDLLSFLARIIAPSAPGVVGPVSAPGGSVPGGSRTPNSRS